MDRWAKCVEHRGRVYGLVEPLYEPAKVLTERNTAARYTGTRLATTLKVMGVDLASMGDVSPQAIAADAQVPPV
jgi:nitrite reductase (NADH) large subunit